jgi:hypothetical protein
MEKALSIQIPEERPSAVPAKAAKKEVKFIPAGNYGLANVMGLKPGNDALLAKFIKPAVVPEFVQKAQRRQSKTSEQLEPVAPVAEAVAKPAAPVVEAVAKPAAIVSPPASNPASVAPSPKEVPKELTEGQKITAAFSAQNKAGRGRGRKAKKDAEAAAKKAAAPSLEEEAKKFVPKEQLTEADKEIAEAFSAKNIAAFRAQNKADNARWKAKKDAEKAAKDAEEALLKAMKPEEKLAYKRAQAKAIIAKWKEQGVMYL